MRTELLFVVFPYVAVGLLVVGLAARYAWARRRLGAVRTQGRPRWGLLDGTAARIALAIVVVAHLAGLLLPAEIRAWNRAPLRLYLLEGSGFLLGLVVLVGWARVMWRHLRDPDMRPAEIGDCVFLTILFVAVLSGLLTAVRFRWGSSWAGATLGPYLASLARGAPATSFVEPMPALVQLHLLSLFALAAGFPFTGAALAALLALDRGLVLVLRRPVAAGTRVARALVARIRPSRWIWPEEDADAAEPADEDPHSRELDA